MIYPGLIRAGTYLSVVTLISGGRYLSMSVVVGCILTFVFWLYQCSKDNRVAKTIRKGRNFSSNPIKMSILYIMAMVAMALQPSYVFAFELHFEIFLIFVASLLIFSYFYLHRTILTIATKDKAYHLLSW